MINYLDFLSPPITLFHLEKRTHTSKTSGILVIIMSSIIIIYISFLIYELINHRNMISIFHKKFQFDVGYYSFNSSSVFYFFQIFSKNNGGFFDKYESKYIRIYTTYIHSNYSQDNLELNDHWVFDTCEDNDRKDIDISLFSHISNFSNSACIRYYYNSTEKKYYSLGDKNFSWPYLEHGLSQSNNVYLTTIVQKCSNFSKIKDILGECPPQKEIDDYLDQYNGIYLHFTDIQVDPTNYADPIQRYIQTISSRIEKNEFFEENFIYYSPLKISTKEGSFLGKRKDINSFFFDYNLKDNKSKDNKLNIEEFIITKYYHFMQNNEQIYERIYNSFFDLFSEIGGVVQFIFYIFFWTNFIYNKYIIAYDTYSLFFSVQNERNQMTNKKNKKGYFFNFTTKNFQLKNIKKNSSNNIINKENNIISENLKYRSKTQNFDANNKINKMINIITDIIPKKNYFQIFKNINKNIDLISPLKTVDNNSSNINLKENLLTNEKNKIIKNNKNYKKIKGKIHYLSNKEYINRITLSKRSLQKIEHNEIKFNENIDKEKFNYYRHFSFIDFLKSICFKANKGSHNYLTIFRKHLLSEEHIFKNHIKIVLLEKNNNLKMNECTNILESYNAL